MMKPFLYTDNQFKNHVTPDGHPECADRIEHLIKLFEHPDFKEFSKADIFPATVEQIACVHGEDYIYTLMDQIPEEGIIYLDGGDTVLSPASFDIALLAAGAAIQAINDIYDDTNKSRRAFCAVRPPGHHAEINKAMGFCLFNNIFIAARHAQQSHNLKRIAIIDFDVHHGNGTEQMARTHNTQNPQTPIFYASTHEGNIFPGTGTPDENNDYIINSLLPAGTGTETFQKQYTEVIFPALLRFNPEIILLSSGFDAHKDEKIANITLKTSDYAWITRKISDFAIQNDNMPIISILEGGYNLSSLVECVKTHLKELAQE